MPCYRVDNGFVCCPRIYEWRGWIFEVHSYFGPWPLKKDLCPRKCAGRKFWAMWERWKHVPNKERFRVV